MKHHPIHRAFVKIIILIALPLGVLMMRVHRAQADSLTWSQLSGSGSHQWISLAVSPSGTYLAGIASDKSADIFVSTDSGTDWANVAPSGSHVWTSIAESSNGQDLFATEQGGYIWSSIDGGTSWTQGTGLPSANWASATVSANGGYAAAIDTVDHTVWTEQGNSNAWTKVRPSFGPWYSVAYSPDGGTLFAGSAGGYVAVSTNQGTSWSFDNTRLGGTFNAVAAGNGGYLAAAGSSTGDIVTSTDGGADWTDTGYGSGTTWGVISESSNGQVIAAASAGYNSINISTNGGSTWETETTPSEDTWGALSVASDASVVVAGGYNTVWKGDLAAPAVPAAPTDVAATTAPGYLSTTITWSAPTGGGTPTKYFVEAIKHGDTNWNDDEIVDDTVFATNPLTDTVHLPAYGEYDIRVSAANGEGPGEYGTTNYTTSAPVVQDISSCAQLQAIDADPTSGYADTYDLTANIDCSSIPNFESLGWTQSGLGIPSTGAFSGIFNGQGHTISNISIVDGGLGDYGVGLFDDANSATLENFTISGSVTGGVRLGGIVGLGENSTLQDITSSLVINDSEASGVGGLVGGLLSDNGTSTISGNTILGDVNGTSSGDVGGLVGNMQATEISGGFVVDNNTVSGNVIGNNNDVGGLVGEVYMNMEDNGGSGVLNADNNVMTGTVTSTTGDQTGGLFGDINQYTDSNSPVSLSITNSSASGDVSSTGGSFEGTGGLIGSIESGTNASGTDTVVLTGDSYRGGLVAGNDEGVVGGLLGYYQVSEDEGTGLSSYTFSQDYSTGNVGGAVALGGLVGFISNVDTGATTPLVSGTISQSYTTGNITEENGGGEGLEGGLVGFYANNFGENGGDMTDVELTLNDVYATGNIQGSGGDGGLLGVVLLPIILDRSYATGSVTGINGTEQGGGGLIGEMAVGGLADSFSTGAVSGFSTDAGGLVGGAGDVGLLDDFYDQAASTQPVCVSGGEDGGDGCNAIDTEDVPDTTYFFDTTNPPYADGYTNWDFTNIWKAHDAAYPTFQGPVVTNLPVANITQTSAVLGGNVASAGIGNIITEKIGYGPTHEINGEPQPLVYTGLQTGNVALGNFTGTADDLLCGTEYLYIAQATNSIGQEGAAQSGTFTTLPCSSLQQSSVGLLGGGYNTGFIPSVVSQAVISSAAAPTPSVVAPVISSPSFVPFRKNLKKGMTSVDVKRLQEFLNDNGYLVAAKGTGSPGHETTLFGLFTKEALMKFQSAHGLASDGAFGPKTRAVVNGILGK